MCVHGCVLKTIQKSGFSTHTYTRRYIKPRLQVSLNNVLLVTRVDLAISFVYLFRLLQVLDADHVIVCIAFGARIAIRIAVSAPTVTEVVQLQSRWQRLICSGAPVI